MYRSNGASSQSKRMAVSPLFFCFWFFLKIYLGRYFDQLLFQIESYYIPPKKKISKLSLIFLLKNPRRYLIYSALDPSYPCYIPKKIKNKKTLLLVSFHKA